MNAELYEALVGGDYEDAQKKAALAATLLRMRGRGETAMTAPGFEDIGKLEVSDSADFAKMLGTNQRMRDIAKEQRAARLQGLALSRAAAEAHKSDAMAFRQQQADERSLAQLSAKLQQANIPQVSQAAKEVSSRFEGKGDEDIKGFGWLDSALPPMFIGEEGDMNRAALSEFANTVLRMQSGLAVTLPEANRFKEMLGTNFGVTDDVLKAQLRKVFKEVENVRSGIEAGYHPRIRQRYYDESVGAERPVISDPFSPEEVENPRTRAASRRPVREITEDDIMKMSPEALAAFIAEEGQ